jgi:hypothetical protein
MVRPEAWGVDKHPDEALSEELFVAGLRSSFVEWANSIQGWIESEPGSEDLEHIEDFRPLVGADRTRNVPDKDRVILEVALHSDGHTDLVSHFLHFVEKCHGKVILERCREIGDLLFVPVSIDKSNVLPLSEYSFIRVLRGMPAIRPYRPGIVRCLRGIPVDLPEQGPLNPEVRAVVFDGGIPIEARAGLAPWVKYIEPDGIGPAASGYESHGLGVTSALLFGPINPEDPPQQPYCSVDHVRVIDTSTDADEEYQYIDVLDRIVSHLDANQGRYHLVNLSLGPAMAIDDDEVTAWTAMLDTRFSYGNSLVTVAVGNDGDMDAASRMNRVQPPSDAVNVLSVGASDCLGADWNRASYSCVGPGRSPGIVKPDGLVFGGIDGNEFGILDKRLNWTTDYGTSFAAPFALRSGAAVMAYLGEDQISPLAVRALIIHSATKSKRTHIRKEVGWGLFDVNGEQLITCDDNAPFVVFEGDLPIGDFLRVPVPMPDTELVGDIKISATLLISPDIDPSYPSSYTRSGTQVFFRPHSERYSTDENGKMSDHPITDEFFTAKRLYRAPEYVLRSDGHKWEPVLKSHRVYSAGDLDHPVFDIRYHHRELGMKASDPKPIPYAMVIGITSEQMPDLYNDVVRAYSQVLIPIRPKTQIRLRGIR